MLVQKLRIEVNDTSLRQNLLGTLQKLSLRRITQSAVIDLGGVEYLFELLADYENLSEYSLEYGTALMMNLCLRSKGKRVCAKDPGKTLKLLKELIESENLQVRSFVFLMTAYLNHYF